MFFFHSSAGRLFSSLATSVVCRNRWKSKHSIALV